MTTTLEQPAVVAEVHDSRTGKRKCYSLQGFVPRRQSVLIFQLDGKIPNIACMRIAEHHKQLGDEVKFRWTGSPERELWDKPDVVYASAIFEKSRPVVDKLRENFPAAITGGTGVDVASNLEAHGITTTRQDYSLYPNWRQSIGFTQRGCRLKCSFCVVPRKEGAYDKRFSWADWKAADYRPENLHATEAGNAKLSDSASTTQDSNRSQKI